MKFENVLSIDALQDFSNSPFAVSYTAVLHGVNVRCSPYRYYIRVLDLSLKKGI
jgi:hypothetical protein